MTPPATRPRGFALVVERASIDAFGLRLEELSRDGAPAHPVAHLAPDRAARIVDRVLEAVQASGHARSDLSPRRRDPLVLKESPGVRIALTMFATGPLRKHRRVEASVGAIDRLSDEEAYYWYGKCMGQSAGRAKRALRLLLAEE